MRRHRWHIDCLADAGILGRNLLQASSRDSTKPRPSDRQLQKQLRRQPSHQKHHHPPATFLPIFSRVSKLTLLSPTCRPLPLRTTPETGPGISPTVAVRLTPKLRTVRAHHVPTVPAQLDHRSREDIIRDKGSHMAGSPPTLLHQSRPGLLSDSQPGEVWISTISKTV